MAKIITKQNLQALIDALIKEGTRVVGPKIAGSLTLYEPLAGGDELDLSKLPRRSAKESFFPLCETILTFQKDKAGTTVTDIDPTAFPASVLIGARPCDAAAPEILDAVFSWDYRDDFFLSRRERTTIIGLACTEADDACFCTAVGLSPGDTKGSDLFLVPLKGGDYRCDVITDKGEKLVASHAGLFTEAPATEPEPLAKPDIAALDLNKIKEWLDQHFEDELWNETAERCAGCGACAFLCPACHCFDISDEGTEAKGARRKHWDACGFGKFTNHASGHNPRDVQPARYRNRIMHKFKYYQDKFRQTLCTGCGRCIRSCPVGIDIAAVLQEIEKQ
ncbi:4Fe-4S dicluster domain-containing protein [Geobacter sp. DSM 9736]|uniref:4Fe-4S dicluster domain-containing protein n=1 Tax=Geobacter sp. DSM 9736 TaxID=1277350 RepID=UPI000B50D22F|nr:4Fe-4S dicluster domain-containing protein [Geobacter sp. DSM 9736]SNB47191.1 4Fe-4S dicluster containing protein [Geobacter sp. DSM 9736]